MVIKTNCGGNKNCKCSKMHRRSSNVSVKTVRHESKGGRDYIVVPVAMIVDGVIMNDAYVPPKEWAVEAWNGRPVTIGHPQVNGEDVSANDPEIQEEWAVGTIFNARSEGGKLRADAWIDVQKCKDLNRHDVVDLLEDEDAEIEVSTGYLCDVVERAGSVKGNKYAEIHEGLIPDHLALLPDDEGACSFQNGCGVRANVLKKAISLITHAFKNFNKPEENMKTKLKKNEKAELIEKIIENEDLPFDESDKEKLESLADEALQAIAEVIETVEEVVEEEGPAPEGNEDDPEKDPEANEDGMEEEPKTNKAGLSKEDRAALSFARNQYKAHRQTLVSKITANSAMTEKQLSRMDTATLETIANGLRSEADYSPMGFTRQANATKQSVVDAMSGGGVVSIIKNRKKEA